MKIPTGMEAMVFSYAYYEIGDFEIVAGFFNHLEKGGLFIIEKHKPKDKEMVGAFIRDYPKNHWNSFASSCGAKQVIGGVEIKNNILKIDTKTKGGLKALREMLEQTLNNNITFQKEEFEDVTEMLRRR